MAYSEATPFSPRGYWSNKPDSEYVLPCLRAHLGETNSGYVQQPIELSDAALNEAIEGMAAQLERIRRENREAALAASAEAREANVTLAEAIASARAALEPHADGFGTDVAGLIGQAVRALDRAATQHASESRQPGYSGQPTQSLTVALEQCQAEKKRRGAVQHAADEATRSSLRRLGVSV